MKCAPSSMNGMLSHCPMFSIILSSKASWLAFYKLHKEAEGEYGSEAVAEIETGGIAWFCTFYTTASL